MMQLAYGAALVSAFAVIASLSTAAAHVHAH